MIAKGILSTGGFEKIPLGDQVQEGQKLSLYYLNDLTEEKIARAKKALIEQTSRKGRDYQGNLDTFNEEVREKRYLLKEGRNLHLIEGEAKKTPEGIKHTLVNLSQSINNFLRGVAIGGNFIVTSQYVTINISVQESERNSKQPTPLMPLPKPPKPAQFFMDRDEDLKKLSELFEKNNKVAITGLGGVGKTQLAYKYIQKQITCENVYVIDASSQETVKEALNDIAEYHKIPVFDYDKLRFSELKEHLNKFQNDFLMFIDNLDDQRDALWIKRYLPNTGRILMTSRLSGIERILGGANHSLGSLSTPAAVKYLLEATGQKSEEAAIRIAEKLHGFPLALSHAAAYIQDFMDLENYFKLLEKKDVAILNKSIQRLDDYEYTVLITWKISLEKIKEEEAFAIDIIEFTSFLTGHNFDLFLLENWSKKYGHGEDAVMDGIRPLCKYSFFNRLSESKTYTIHPLVQKVVRTELLKIDLKKANEIARQVDQVLKALAIKKKQAQKLKPQQVADEAPRVKAYIQQISSLKDSQEDINKLYDYLSSETYQEPLRLAFIEGLANNMSSEELKSFTKIPNKLTGYRYSYYQKYQELKTCLEHMTTDQPSPLSGIKVKVTTTRWSQNGLMPVPEKDEEESTIADRYLKPEIIEQIIEPECLAQQKASQIKFVLQRQFPASLHRVAKAKTKEGHSLHFKERPTHPCMEFAVTSLMYRLFGHGAPPLCLAKFTIEGLPDGEEFSTAVMISLTEKGDTLTDLIKKDTRKIQALKKQKQFSEMLISQLLLMPSDAHSSNFIATRDGLVCIDNEASFIPIKKPDSKDILFKSHLFKLGGGKLSRRATNAFKKWDAHMVLAGWLNELLHQNRAWTALFKRERKMLAKPIRDPHPLNTIIDPKTNKLREVNCVPSLILPKGTITRLYRQMTHLKEFFKDNPSPKYKTLLEQMLSCWEDEPTPRFFGCKIAKRYAKHLDSKEPAELDHTVSSSSMIIWDNLLGKVPTKAAIQTGKYSPKQALQELSITQYFFDARVINGKPSDNTSFKVMDTSRQWIFLRLLQHDDAVERLMLPGFTVLDDKTLDQILTKHQESIKTLDLRGRENIDFQSLKKLKKLSSLDISEATCGRIHPPHHLKTLKANYIEVKEPLKIKSSRLEHLELRGCRSSLDMEAPNLKYLDLSCNRALEEIKLDTPKLEKLTVVEYFADKVKSQVPQSCKITEIEWKFGAKKWAKYIGEVGEEPPLPEKLEKLLKSPCPYWDGKQIKDTHMLTLIPATVNGEELTLERLGELVKTPKAGHAGHYNDWDPGGNEKAKVDRSYWTLMTKDVIPGTRNEGYYEQRKLLKKNYEAPKLIEAAVSIFMAYVSEKEELYTRNPWIYTRCQEAASGFNYQMMVGGSAGGGLDVNVSMSAVDICGLAGVRKL